VQLLANQTTSAKQKACSEYIQAGEGET